jgi:outer membrane protein assembly factor BamA
MFSKFFRFLIFILICQYSYAQSQSIYYISEINLIGNKKTKEEIIIRELTFKKGDSIKIDNLFREINESENNLLNTSLFNFVTISDEYTDFDVVINILLEERWYLWPYPIFEYADRNFNIWLREKEYERLNYGLHLIKYNFRGRREILNVKIRLGFREQYQIYYENPYIDKQQKVGFYAGFTKFRQKEIPFIVDSNQVKYFADIDYLQNETFTDLGAFYRNNYYLTHHIGLSYYQSTVSDTVLELNPNFHGTVKNTQSYIRIGYSIDYDHRDSKIYPLSGNRYFGSAEQIGLGVFNNNSDSYFQFKAGIQSNIELAEKWYYSSTIIHQSILIDNPPYISQSGLGYDEFLRGFEYYVVQGSSHSIFSNETKYNFLPKKVYNFSFLSAEKFNKTFLAGYINLFFDVGYVNTSIDYRNDFMTNKILYSGGIGIDFVTYYDKILRINYAINNFKEINLYLHFNIPF